MAHAPNELGAIEALAAIASGRLTAEALTRACLDRIAARDSVVRAFAYLDPERALAEARACDRARQARRAGPLTGLPFGVWVRRGLLAGALAMIVVSGDIAGWAASIERSTSAAGNQAAHAHVGAAASRQPTAAELEAATKLIVETRAAVGKYADLKAALAAGYKPMEPPDFQIVHYVNPGYMVDADILNPNHVQSLIYYNGKDGTQLIGAMFIMPRRGMDGPQVGGPLTVWHQHSNICFDNATGMAVAFAHSGFFDNNEKSGTCPRGSTNKTTPLMLHVWLIDNPDGPFATDMEPSVLGTAAPVA